MESAAASPLNRPWRRVVKRGAPWAAPLFLFLAMGLQGCGRWEAPAILMKLPAQRGASGLALDPSGKTLAVVGQSKGRESQLRLINLEAEPPSSVRITVNGDPTCATWKGTDGTLVLGGSQGIIQMVGQVRKRVLRSRRLDLGPIRCIAWESSLDVLLLGIEGRSSLAVVDARTLRLLKEIKLDGDAWRVELDGQGRAYVATRGSDSLGLVRLVDRRSLASGAASHRPAGLSLDLEEGLVWLGTAGNTAAATSGEPALLKLRLEDGMTLDRFLLDQPAEAAAAWPGGVAVLHSRPGFLRFYDRAGRPVGGLEVGSGAKEIVVDSNSGLAYVSLAGEGSVAVVALPYKKP